MARFSAFKGTTLIYDYVSHAVFLATTASLLALKQ